jgi:hypothetical protein
MPDNVIDLAAARIRPKQGAPNKRMHPRVETNDRLFTQVVLAADDPDLVGTTVACSTVNTSVGGIQFKTQVALPIGALLDLWVEVASQAGKFFLTGEVRWTRPGASRTDGTPVWHMGVQLTPGAATDILNWRDFHATAITP